ncbi:MAG: hypothetical protein D6690_17570 [Nitrospirae bacterium]|nr:MAG: hypothetical protein D6690_17570 [Nitrospirota bacterium]
MAQDFGAEIGHYILVGGEKVHPVEVETVIAELPYVREVIVMGEPHPFLGQIVVAIVSVDDAPANASSPSIKNIRAHCRTRLAPYKIPIKIFITQELPAPYRQKKMRRCRPEYLPSPTRQA